ncbi:hypothetical protein [Clostridium beijerinckii]|nr:hypothetical protein [Clostridium beijerinckii]NRT72727.1 hypothetical protein [Clostridium beijerinckii]
MLVIKKNLIKLLKSCPSLDEKIEEINEVYKEKDNLCITVI